MRKRMRGWLCCFFTKCKCKCVDLACSTVAHMLATDSRQPRKPPAGFTQARGVNDPGFIMWSRFGQMQRAYGAPSAYALEGAAKLGLHQQRERERYRVTNVDDSAAALMSALAGGNNARNRSDVDRVVFGRDQDNSEAADDVLLTTLERHRARERPASAMPTLHASGRLMNGTPLGASRPSAVRPRPSSGGRPAHILHVQRGTPEFRAEMEKQRRKIRQAYEQSRARPWPPEDVPGVPGPAAFHTSRR